MKTETVVLLAIGGAALAAGLIYYAKQKQPKQVNPLAAPTNGNPNNNSAPANSTSADVANYTKAAGDGLSAIEGFFGW
jgi:threonine dehydratase